MSTQKKSTKKVNKKKTTKRTVQQNIVKKKAKKKVTRKAVKKEQAKKEKKHLDIMVDLESLGNKDKPVLMQLSAVLFNRHTGKNLEEFNEFICPKSGIDAGLDVQGDTVAWWLTQDKEVIKKVFVKAILEGLPLKEVLEKFNAFLEAMKEKYNVESIILHGNGLISDGVWIMSAYKAVNVDNPFKYYEYQDVRTLCQVGYDVLGVNFKASTKFVGNQHDGLDDCKHQIKYCTKYMKALKKHHKRNKIK